jgi:hypothetical protein
VSSSTQMINRMSHSKSEAYSPNARNKMIWPECICHP